MTLSPALARGKRSSTSTTPRSTTTCGGIFPNDCLSVASLSNQPRQLIAQRDGRRQERLLQENPHPSPLPRGEGDEVPKKPCCKSSEVYQRGVGRRGDRARRKYLGVNGLRNAGGGRGGWEC